MTHIDKYTWVATATCGDQVSFQSSTPGVNPEGDWYTNSNALKAWLGCPAALEDKFSASPDAKGILDKQGQTLVNGRRYWYPDHPCDAYCSIASLESGECLSGISGDVYTDSDEVAQKSARMRKAFFKGVTDRTVTWPGKQ